MWSKCPSIASKDKAGITQIHIFADSTLVKFMHQPSGAKGYYPAYEVLKPLTDKLVRAQPLRGRMQANKLYWPARATWYENLKTEFLRFPAGTHDDQIDSLAWAIRLTLSKSAPKPPAQKELKSWKDKLSAYTENSGGGHMSA
jgi:predicted phage terminase large subunit-like protein